MSKTWTTFDRTTYDAYISAIRIFQGNQPLWATERLWNPNGGFASALRCVALHSGQTAPHPLTQIIGYRYGRPRSMWHNNVIRQFQFQISY
jgi:hypothetical protein